jgi:hypothetical protein
MGTHFCSEPLGGLYSKHTDRAAPLVVTLVPLAEFLIEVKVPELGLRVRFSIGDVFMVKLALDLAVFR